MTIHIEALTFDTIIGLLEFERINPQSVIVDVQISYNYKNEQFINYADVSILIKHHLQEKCYELLEEALEGLKDLLYAIYPQIKTLNIKISKPNILAECNVALSHSWKF